MRLTRELLGITMALIVGLVACTSGPAAPVMPTSVATSTLLPTTEPASTPAAETMASFLVPCDLEPLVVPTRPPETPGYTQLDPDTGLHMTGRPQEIDLESYRLEVTGKVAQPLSLTLDDLRCLPRVELSPRLECPGFFVDEATWAGAPIREVLALAGAREGATGLNLISADGYSRFVPISELVSEAGYLAYEWEGEPLPILHGFPVRVVLPGMPGGDWVKWLVAIEVK